ncbi:putative nuclease HARBI1 [Haliotis rubra]|uniref:putative nuclease HARBI1 n=1 Tax=Haliotis rubra TaxID=36100 RepID=UPI001EE4F431|nr:putative nuclease HARBI1 [Haliotis rubra]
MEIGDLHGVHESSVSRSVHRTIRAINNVLDIKFNPDANKVRMQDFYKIAEFPCVIGAIDGTLIPIKRPPADEEVAYVCRKGFHAINVQAVCDANLRFINTVIRWPGSCHDSMIFSNSSLGQYLELGNVDGWLLGDSGYPCRPWILTPLLNPESKSEVKYNSAHCKTRNTIERAFGVLKSRFRCLHKSTGCLQFSPEKCNAVIMAAFKLHNFCKDNNLPDPPMIMSETDNSTDYSVDTDLADGVSIRRELIAKRFS